MSHQQGRLVYNSYLAYTLSKFNDNQSVFENLYLVFRQYWDKSKSCLLHSDQGFQYTNKQYYQKLEAVNVTVSHSRKGNCLFLKMRRNWFSRLTISLHGITLIDHSLNSKVWLLLIIGRHAFEWKCVFLNCLFYLGLDNGRFFIWNLKYKTWQLVRMILEFKD